MNYYKRNLDFFKQNAALLYTQLTEENDQFQVQVLKTKEGMVAVRERQKCFVHSVYNTENEVFQMTKKINKDAEVTILFGIGDGTVVDFLLNNYKKLKKIIVVEPSRSIFELFMEKVELENIIKSALEREVLITFIVNQPVEFSASLLKQELANCYNISVCVHVYIYSLFSEYYYNLNEAVKKQLKLALISVNTVSVQWKIWMINSLRNLACKQVYPVELIKKSFDKKTVVLVSAGPSLNKNMHLISELSSYCTIVAVGSAIGVLDGMGIGPDYRVAIDAYPAEKTIFDNLNNQRGELIFSNQLYYDILPNYPGKKIRYLLNTDYLGKYFYKSEGIDFVEIESGPSVANGAVDLICALGAKQVIFLGQDFSYTKEGLHAKGLNEASIQADQEWLKNMDYIETTNIYGDTVYTMSQYLAMKQVMETTIKKHVGVEFINASEGGLGLEGVKNVRLSHVLEDLSKFSDYKMNDEKSLSESKLLDYQSALSLSFEKYREEIFEINEICKLIFKKIKKLEKKVVKGHTYSQLKQEIGYIETLFNELSSIELYEEVVQNELRADIFVLRKTIFKSTAEQEDELESKFRFQIGYANKLREYLDLADELIKEILFTKSEG